MKLKHRIGAAFAALVLAVTALVAVDTVNPPPAEAYPATIYNAGSQSILYRTVGSTTNRYLAPGSSTSNVRYIHIYVGKCLSQWQPGNEANTWRRRCPTVNTFYEMPNGAWSVRQDNR